MPKAFKILTGMLLLLLGCSKSVFCQLYDNNWVMCRPNVLLNFGNNELRIDSQALTSDIFMFTSSVSISDTTGDNLLFFSNAARIYDKYGNMMEDGDQLLLSQQDLDYVGQDTTSGMGIGSNPSCIPYPFTTDSFMFLHRSLNDTFQSVDIYYSIIDMSKNGGLGKVVSPSNYLGSGFSNAGLGICKHANGNDWWIITKKATSNLFYKFLLSKNGITLIDTQSVGPVYIYPDFACEAVFNFSGNKFTTSDFRKIGIYDFDRCTGHIVHQHTISPPFDTIYEYLTGCYLSNSGRFLYTSGFNIIDQYDLQSQNIDSSRTIVAQVDRFSFYKFFHMQMGPDNRIYIAGYNAPTPLSIINFPEQVGLSCQVDTFSIFLNRNNTWGMPVYPHYRTPAVPAYQAGAGHNQTVCDSVVSASGVKLGVPAVDSITYQWSSTDDAAFGGSTLAEPIVHPTASATYIVHLTDTANTWYSCTDRWDTVHISVTSICNTAITGVASKAFQLWPTVTGSTGPVYLKAEDKGTLKLYTATGTLLQQSNYSSEQNTLTLNNLSPAVYLYSAGNGRHIYYGKIVVQ